MWVHREERQVGAGDPKRVPSLVLMPPYSASEGGFVFFGWSVNSLRNRRRSKRRSTASTFNRSSMDGRTSRSRRSSPSLVGLACDSTSSFAACSRYARQFSRVNAKPALRMCS